MLWLCFSSELGGQLGAKAVKCPGVFISQKTRRRSICQQKMGKDSKPENEIASVPCSPPPAGRFFRPLCNTSRCPRNTSSAQHPLSTFPERSGLWLPCSSMGLKEKRRILKDCLVERWVAVGFLCTGQPVASGRCSFQHCSLPVPPFPGHWW